MSEFARAWDAEEYACVRARRFAHEIGLDWRHIGNLAREIAWAHEVGSPPEPIAPPGHDDRVAFAGECFKRCGSPIEELFLACCADPCFQFGPEFGVGRWDFDWVSGELMLLDQQVSVGSFRLDFALRHQGRKVAIELDGHEWHERDKRQAEKDKSRDRFLQSEGWKVLRFTGTEIWRNPVKCVSEARAIAAGDPIG